MSCCYLVGKIVWVGKDKGLEGPNPDENGKDHRREEKGWVGGLGILGLLKGL